MDNQSTNGYNSLLVSIILGIFSWLRPDRIDLGLKIGTGLGAIIAAIFAIRYHITATKVKEKELENLNNANKK